MFVAFRLWLSARLADLCYWVMPQPHRGMLKAHWYSSVGEHEKALREVDKAFPKGK